MLSFFRSRPRQGKHAFGLLTPHDHSSHSKRHSSQVPRRYSRAFIGVLCMLGVLGLYSTLDIDIEEWLPLSRNRLPPLYPKYRQNELALPQHNPDLPLPEGRHGKYIWMSEHVYGSGWGNALQEHFVNGLLSYASERSFVFDNYTWNRNGTPFSEFNGKLIPSVIPMTALIEGPLAGGPFPLGDKTPRSVMKEYFDTVCPHPKLLDKEIVRATLPSDYSAKTVMNAWLKLLKETPDNCVKIDDIIFDIWIFGSTRILDIIPLLYQSPMVTEFRWSSLVLSTFERNKRLFAPRGLTAPTAVDPYPIIPGLLALHIRRGDFEAHCRVLAEWGSSWTGFSQLPEMIDYFEPSPRPESGQIAPAVYDKYTKSCYPSIEQIVQKVVEVRRTKAGKGLKNVFIMTNAKKPWIQELKDALNKAAKWDLITSSRNMKLNWEQKYIAQAPDMLIGQRSQVFIGNGFSSLTANIVMLRMAKGLDPEYTRLWST